jgi:S-(hydroxymethyl)glutathione dehydrogenase / alcohol dehydrogenase
MKAAVLFEPNGKLSVENVDISEPKKDEVLIKISASGLCHTDWETMRGYQPVNLPAIIGHEGAGIVEAVGEGVDNVEIGDHVICSWNPNCGICFYCDNDQPILCEIQKKYGSKGVLFDGTTRASLNGKNLHYYSLVSSHAEYTIIPKQAAVKVRKDFPLDKAALLGCAVMTGYGGAVYAGNIKPETSVVVIGCGAVGLSAIQGARISGASKIIAVDIFDNKLEFAKRVGATHTINSKNTNPVEFCLDITEGRGVDCAIESAGQNETIRQTLECSRPGARIVILGKTPYGVEINLPFYTLMGEREIIRTSYGKSHPRIDFPRLANLYMSGRLFLDEMITKTYDIEEINTGFDALENGELARGLIIFK